MYMERCVNERDIDFMLDLKTAVFALTHCPKPGTCKTGFRQVKIMKEFV